MSSGDEDVTKAIVHVRNTLHEMGFGVNDEQAAKVYIAALDGTIEHVKDPRKLGAAMAGPGGPYDFGQTTLDARRALIVDYQQVCKVDPDSAGDNDQTFALLFEGRINQTPDRASVMLLGDIDFMAATITELHHVARRAGLHDKLTAACEERWRKMPPNTYLVQRFV